MNRKFWQASCKHCDYVTRVYYEDDWNNAEAAAVYDLDLHIELEHKDENALRIE